ncbi:MAG TPA: bifunctional DNA-formamidopyrimidine glycosylase/DNA-(apurinic or apyrimidinic site) lyase [Candidatus Nanopelagicaceae bacterium]|nr:bifunctional DNA-formamidopyrimidine glycosylase/DNA-(apurinic or apyrimidinic site) lyase [Candidatus Nanopelagicaceae bacterium]
MPELPEVEVVRSGLARHLVGHQISEVDVLHPRAIRKHVAGAKDFQARLAGLTIEAIRRRGKYLWFELDDNQALIGHLGMSGQFLLLPLSAEEEKHLRIRFEFADWPMQLRFVDQRTFGGMSIDELEIDESTGEGVPSTVAHIARDPFDPKFELAPLVTKLRSRHTEIKRLLLDQSVVSGIGNIYADESLWRAGIHPTRLGSSLTKVQLELLMNSAKEVMADALAAGGTSFDDLYVNVNGESGYFERSLAVYGRRGEPCSRCGKPIVRAAFMNRSSHYCPACQRPPRAR